MFLTFAFAEYEYASPSMRLMIVRESEIGGRLRRLSIASSFEFVRIPPPTWEGTIFLKLYIAMSPRSPDRRVGFAFKNE